MTTLPTPPRVRDGVDILSANDRMCSIGIYNDSALLGSRDAQRLEIPRALRAPRRVLRCASVVPHPRTLGACVRSTQRALALRHPREHILP